MKFYPCGSLLNLIHEQSTKATLNNIPYTDPLIFNIGLDICTGLAAIHDAGLFHSDMKPPNVLLDYDDRGQLYAAITDFGVTRIVQQKSLLVKAFQVSLANGASLCYAAPEALSPPQQEDPHVNPELVKAADVYSLAVILFELATRVPPWAQETTPDMVVKKVAAGMRPYPRKMPLGPKQYHQQLRDLIERCWAQQAFMRPRMTEVVDAMTRLKAIVHQEARDTRRSSMLPPMLQQ